MHVGACLPSSSTARPLQDKPGSKPADSCSPRLWQGEASAKVAVELTVGLFLIFDPLLVVRE